MKALLVLALLAAPVHARTIRGTVFDDRNGDGLPSAGEPGVANAVVALGIKQFTVTDQAGVFTLEVAPETERALAWVRVPDGFTPGPVWSPVEGRTDIDLALRRLAQPHRGPLTFVVAADTHMTIAQPFWKELSAAADAAVALDPPPAFFTILGDITSGNKDEQFDLVDEQLAGLGVPYVPVPGNHDWYDEGVTWFRRYGPDNYSFDLDRVHFVVWNMMMPVDDIEAYLGAELARVPEDMTIVALTHAPPAPAIIATLSRLGVDYVLTGHTHSNRAVDHDGLVELTTEPFMMGGLDFTPAGYRVLTIDRSGLAAAHRTTAPPHATVISPSRGRCVPPIGGEVIVAAELDGGAPTIRARVDCATPLALAFAGGWSWRGRLPTLEPGMHSLSIEAASSARAGTTIAFEVCDAVPLAPRRGMVTPPLAARWVATAGGHVLQAPPAVTRDAVFVSATDLGRGTAGGVVAFELATGAIRWRVATERPVRGGPAVVGTTVVVAQLDGTVLGLDVATGAERWRYELGAGLAPEAASVFASPVADGAEVLIGNQRHLAAIAAESGRAMWRADPVPTGAYSQSLAAVASASGVVVGAFHRELGGVVAFDRVTGRVLWRLEGEQATAINATPVIAGDTVYLVNGLTEVIALDLFTGTERWQVKLDPDGFDWGNATTGGLAIAHGVLLVPTLYRDLVALDAATGAELWRLAGTPSRISTTHYRGAREAGFEATPAITGDLVWAADTAGRLTAVELRTGKPLWHGELGAPVLAGLAVAGNWLVVASYDGTVRALGPADRPYPPFGATSCEPPAKTGCCSASADPPWLVIVVVFALRRRRAIA